MAYDKIVVPKEGKKITIQNGRMVIPDNPILPFIEGDGIGPDIWRATKRILDAAVQAAYGGQRKISWMEVYAGEKAAHVYGGDYLPQETLDAFNEFIVGIKGPLTTPIGGGFRSLNVAIRKRLDLYACVRPVRYYKGIPSPMKRPDLVDMVIFRENTEDVYSGIEYEAGTPENDKVYKFLTEEMGADIRPGSGIGIKPISKFGTQRLIRKAIQYALDRGRKSVTIMHKGNIMKYTEGAFMRWGYELAKEEFRDEIVTEDELWKEFDGKMPEGKILFKDRIADITFQQMLLRPAEYDIIATPNLNGDYLSDALAAQVGGVGIAPGSNIGDFVAVFEATHGTAPKYTNMDKVNPGSLLFSGVMMLEYMEWWKPAKMIQDAYEKTVAQKIVTYDFARQMEGATKVKTSEFATAIIKNL